MKCETGQKNKCDCISEKIFCVFPGILIFSQHFRSRFPQDRLQHQKGFRWMTLIYCCSVKSHKQGFCRTPNPSNPNTAHLHLQFPMTVTTKDSNNLGGHNRCALLSPYGPSLPPPGLRFSVATAKWPTERSMSQPSIGSCQGLPRCLFTDVSRAERNHHWGFAPLVWKYFRQKYSR